MIDPVLQFIPDIPSTNQWLAEEAAEGISRGVPLTPFTAVFTDFQEDGHGMGTNKWFSERGKNMLLSVYFTARTSAARQFLFNQYFAVATRKFLLQHLPEVAIKWPNDIYVNGKKIAGILIEHHLRGDALQYTIAGIGININQDHFPDAIPHPTSLHLETGKIFSVEELTCQYWEILQECFDDYDWDADIAINPSYIESLYQLNKWHEYIIKGERREAKIIGLDAFGRLRLSMRDGSESLCGFKEIVFI